MQIIYNILLRLNPISLFMNFTGYNDEKLADSFATIYGYGADLGAAIAKIDYTDNSILDKIINAWCLPIMLVALPTDCHPETISRMKNQVNYLQDELANGVHNKEIKRSIKKQIDTINNQIDDIVNFKQYKLTKFSTNKFRLLYSILLHKVFKMDFKEVISHSNDNHEEIERVLRRYTK